jgi:hypothetical protein
MLERPTMEATAGGPFRALPLIAPMGPPASATVTAPFAETVRPRQTDRTQGLPTGKPTRRDVTTVAVPSPVAADSASNPRVFGRWARGGQAPPASRLAPERPAARSPRCNPVGWPRRQCGRPLGEFAAAAIRHGAMRPRTRRGAGLGSLQLTKPACSCSSWVTGSTVSTSWRRRAELGPWA